MEKEKSTLSRRQFVGVTATAAATTALFGLAGCSGNGGGSQASVAAAHYADTTDATAQVQVPMSAEPVAYSTPQTGNVAVAAATPMPSAVEKDLSGFGDADDDFSFDELD